MRKRYQKGSLQKKTYGGRRVWVGLYYDEKGVRVNTTLGDRSGLTEMQARTKLADLLNPINKTRASAQLRHDITLADYVEGHYIPFGERKWKGSTFTTTSQRLRQHIVSGELAFVRVRDLARENMQRFLDSRGISSFSVVNHLRWDLKAICDLAISDGILDRNQADQLYTPRTVTLPSQPVMTPEQVRRALAVLDLRERVFCRLAIYAGMRPGEIIALRWPDIRDGFALVDDRFYKGKQDTTKNRKSRPVALSTSVIRDLEAWRAFAPSGDSLLFASENLKTPIKYENIWQREIKPRFEKIGLAWADFRCMRRTNSTLMKAAGADPKVAADNRGHGVRVAMDEYTHSTMEQKREAVGKLEGLIQ